MLSMRPCALPQQQQQRVLIFVCTHRSTSTSKSTQWSNIKRNRRVLRISTPAQRKSTLSATSTHTAPAWSNRSSSTVNLRLRNTEATNTAQAEQGWPLRQTSRQGEKNQGIITPTQIPRESLRTHTHTRIQRVSCTRQPAAHPWSEQP